MAEEELKQRYDRLLQENMALRNQLNKRSQKVTGLILELEDYRTCVRVLGKQYKELMRMKQNLSFPQDQRDRKLKPALKREITKEKILEKQKQGMSVKQIAETFGVTRQTIYNRLQ